jgi:hypothetical protein
MTVTIRVSLFDSGCLPVLLGKELAAVLRRQRLQEMTPDDARELELYRVQISNCLAAVAIARRGDEGGDTKDLYHAQKPMVDE